MSFVLEVLLLPRNALLCKARSYDRTSSVRLSVRLSIRVSVALVDCDHIGWKSWKLIAQTISPKPLLFVANQGDPPTPREHREIWGRLEVG